MRRKFHKWSKGVTLVELMVVVALIAIIAAIASPGISRGIERANARSGASEVAATLRLARDQAKTRQIPLWVSITPEAAGSRGIVTISRHNDDAVRSCREFAAASLAEVARLELNTVSGQTAIKEVSPAPVNGFNVCFSPQGTVHRPNGTPLVTPAGACAGEGGLVLLWQQSAANPAATVKNCAANAAARPGQRDDRDAIHFFKVPIVFNGTIKVEQ